MGNKNISDGQIVRYTYDIIAATGHFVSACIKWRGKNNADLILAKFKVFFTKAAKDSEKTSLSPKHNTQQTNYRQLSNTSSNN